MYSNEKIKKFCRVSLFALGIGLGMIVSAPTQALLPQGSTNATGPVPLNQSATAKDASAEKTDNTANSASEIPDEIALFDDGAGIPTPGDGLITPNGGTEPDPMVKENAETGMASSGLGADIPTPGQTTPPTSVSANAANATSGINPAALASTPNSGALPTLQPGNPLIAKVPVPQTTDPHVLRSGQHP